MRSPKGTGFPGFAIVASEAEHTLSAISLERFRVTRQLGLEAAPSEVMALSDPPLVLCLLPGRGTLVAIDNQAVAVRHRVRVGDESLAMRLDPDGKRVWILNKSPNTLVAVDLKSFRPRAARAPARNSGIARRIRQDGRGQFAATGVKLP